MIIHRSFISPLTYLFGPLAFLLLLGVIPAFPASISLEYSLGFNGLFQLGKWAPLNIMLENNGRTTSGTLEIIVTSGSEYRRDVHYATYAMDVELPTNSKKLYSFTILIDSFTHPLIMRLKQSQRTLLSTSLNLRPHYATKRLVPVVGEGIATDFISMLPKGVLPVISPARFLPETWYGYDGVEMLILHASALSQLRERQFIALTEWVTRGGYIVTAGSLNYGAFLKERTRRLLPVNILGVKRIYELNSLEGFCGEGLSSPDPFLILHAEIDESVALLKEDDIPIIIQREMWLGKVIFLAFDYQAPPFTNWTGRCSFWNEMLALKPRIAHSSFDFEEQNILSSMISGIPTHFPRFILALSFFAVYAILIKIIFMRVGGNRGQRRRNISYLLAISIVFSMVSCWLLSLKNAQKDLSYNSFHHVKNVGHNMIASSRYIVGFYSIRGGDYRLSLGPTFSPITPILPHRAEDIPLHSLALHENDVEQTISVSMDRWSHRFFQINSMIKFPIQGKVFQNEQGLVIMIENLIPHAIIDCQIYFANRLFFLGNIAPSGKLVKRLARSDISQKELFQVETVKNLAESIVPYTPTSFLEVMQKDLMESLLRLVHSRYHSREDVLHLFGWIESELISVNLNHSGITGEGVALLEWEIPVRSSTENSKAELVPNHPSPSETLSGKRNSRLRDLV
jgi:hypothetical protein